MADRAKLVHAAVEAWKEAARQLHIQVVAPFTVSVGHVTAACIAFLPDFGGNHGMVVGAVEPPEFDTERVIVECATASGMFYSFLNLERYSTFDAEVFMEALTDWGYFGSAETRPDWFPSNR